MQSQDHASSRTILAVHFRALDKSGNGLLQNSRRRSIGKPLVRDDAGVFLAVAPPIISDVELLKELQSLNPDGSDAWYETNLTITTERQSKSFNSTDPILRSAVGGKSYYLKNYNGLDGPYPWSTNHDTPIEVSYKVSGYGLASCCFGASVSHEIISENLHPAGSLQSRLLAEIITNLFTIINCHTSYKVEMGFTLQTSYLGSCTEKYEFPIHTDRLRSKNSATEAYANSEGVETIIQRTDNSTLAAGLRFFPEGFYTRDVKNRGEPRAVEILYQPDQSLLFTNYGSHHQGFAGGTRGEESMSEQGEESMSEQGEERSMSEQNKHGCCVS